MNARTDERKVEVEQFKARYKKCLTDENLMEGVVKDMIEAGITEKQMIEFYTIHCFQMIEHHPIKIMMEKQKNFDDYLRKNMTVILTQTIAETIHEIFEDMKKE